jgi:hypothetical protein
MADDSEQYEVTAKITAIADYPNATVIVTVLADTLEDAQALIQRTLGRR